MMNDLRIEGVSFNGDVDIESINLGIRDRVFKTLYETSENLEECLEVMEKMNINYKGIDMDFMQFINSTIYSVVSIESLLKLKWIGALYGGYVVHIGVTMSESAQGVMDVCEMIMDTGIPTLELVEKLKRKLRMCQACTVYILRHVWKIDMSLDIDPDVIRYSELNPRVSKEEIVEFISYRYSRFQETEIYPLWNCNPDLLVNVLEKVCVGEDAFDVQTIVSLPKLDSNRNLFIPKNAIKIRNMSKDRLIKEIELAVNEDWSQS